MKSGLWLNTLGDLPLGWELRDETNRLVLYSPAGKEYIFKSDELLSVIDAFASDIEANRRGKVC